MQIRFTPPPIDSGDRSAASHKAWLINTAAALESLSYWLISAFGQDANATGVLRTSLHSSPLTVEPHGASMAVHVTTGGGIHDTGFFMLESQATLGAFTAPGANKDFWLVYITPSTCACTSVLIGNAASLAALGYASVEEAAAAIVPSGSLELAVVTVPSTATVVKATSDGTNGYIDDARVVLN